MGHTNNYNISNGLTRGELVDKTEAPPYKIDYLRSLRRLPLIRPSSGPGIPNLYHPDSIKIVKEHLKKSHNEVSE